jgi:hypothetical protein
VNRQAEILYDALRRERELATSPVRLEQRSLARLARAIASCCRPSFATRLLGALERPARAFPVTR